MKKNHCNYCKDQTCRECGRLFLKADGINISPDLYAAEFMLYAFHFEQEFQQIRSNASARAIPLMILATEG